MAENLENEEVAIRMRAKASLKAYRASRKWSMREMAGFLQVPAKSYEAYEAKEDRGVPIAVIARFCVFADEDINWILYGRRARRAG